MRVVKRSTLSTVKINGEVGAYIFDGSTYGTSVSAFVVDVSPDLGPKRHKHPYDEIFIVVEGSVRLESDGDEYTATAEDVCIVPADAPHSFTNVGPGRARMVNIHAAPKVITEFVEGGPVRASYEYGHPS